MDSPVPGANDLECAPADTEVDEEHKAEVPEALGALESVLLPNEQHDSMIHASEDEEFVLQAFITSEMDFLMQSEAVELQSFMMQSGLCFGKARLALLTCRKQCGEHSGYGINYTRCRLS